MRLTVVGLGMGLIFLAGCSSYTPYPYQDYPGAAKPSGVSRKEAPKTSVRGVSSNAVSVPMSSNAGIGMMLPANPPTIVAPKSPGRNVVQIPATPATVQGTASTTNKPESAVSAATVPAESEFVNGAHRRAHLRFKEKGSEEAFLKIVAKKQAVFEDLRVIGKLCQEKNNQQQQFAASLQEQFAVKPDGNYQYDAGSRTIAEIVKSASGGEASQTQLHMKLKDEATAQNFVRLATAKRVSLEEMATLQLIYREKQMELAEYDRQLADAYAIVKDRNYQYDPTTKTLYELIRLPEGVEAPKSSGIVPMR
jgi:hypothetical protein